MNTFQIRAFVTYLKKQKEISNEKRKMVSDVVTGGINSVVIINNCNSKSKKFGDKGIRIDNR